MSENRFYWLDFFKSLAILMMIIYHLAFDINFFQISHIDVFSGIWVVIARFIQFTFFLIVGFSLFISYSKSKDYNKFVKHQFIRSIKLFGIAMCLTLTTFLFYPEGYIRFGVLHMLSFAIIIGALLIRSNRLPIYILISLILGSVFSHITLTTPLFMPLGISYDGFYSLDYFPIFPWVSLIFAGIVSARIFDKYKLLRNFKFFPRIKIFEIVSKKALIIYLVHQPVLLGAIWLLCK